MRPNKAQESLLREFIQTTLDNSVGQTKSSLAAEEELETMKRTSAPEEEINTHLDDHWTEEDFGPVPPGEHENDPVVMLDPYVKDWLP